MTDHYQRSRVLIDRGRYDQAEKELRQVLSVEPDYAVAHGLLAVCLSEKKQYGEALKEISEAISLSPSHPGFHYIHAEILQKQNNLEMAKTAILEALRLNPGNADYYARLATIQHDQTKYTEALKSSEQGLSIDAEHVWSMNMRLLSLLELGRISEAEAEVNGTLAIAPDHPFPHSVKGWVFLHQNRIPEAMQSFREALRIEPGRQWARKGLLEALKARNGVYRFILRLELGQSRLTPLQKIAFVGLLIIPYLQVLIILSILLAVLTKPLFTLLLCFDPYGKLTLTQEEITKKKQTAICISSFIPGALLSLFTHNIGWILLLPMIAIPLYSFIQWRKSSQEEDLLKFILYLPICIFTFTLAITAVFPENLVDAKSILIRVAYGVMGLVLFGLLLTIIGSIFYTFIISLIKPLAKPAITFARFLPQKQKTYILKWLKPYEDIVLSEKEKSDFNRAVFIFFSFIPGFPLYILTYQAGWLFIAPALFILIYSLRKFQSSESNWKDKATFIYMFFIGIIVLTPGIALFFPLPSLLKTQILMFDLLSLIFVIFFGFFLYATYVIANELLAIWKARLSGSKNTSSIENRK
jgi:tetratricopeptide (TPR) repeat protein